MGDGRRFTHRADENAGGIWGFARRLKASVQVLTNVGFGCPDGLVGFQGRNHLVEIKVPGKDLTDSQRDWVGRWRGDRVAVVRTGDDLVRLLLGVSQHPVAFGAKDAFRYEVWRVNVLTGDRTLVRPIDEGRAGG
jgi:hypothetical protein